MDALTANAGEIATFLSSANPHLPRDAVNGLLIKRLPYDILRDFLLIGLASNGPHVLMVRNDFPAKSAPDLIAMATFDLDAYGHALHAVGPGRAHFDLFDFTDRLTGDPDGRAGPQPGRGFPQSRA